MNIVLLPQLFGELNDFNYYKKLLSDLPDSYQGRIFLVSDNYNSDIQRYIIANAEFVIGARYHSVVFSIKSETPFICLSYEHKMMGLLKKLKLTDKLIDINDYLKMNITKESVIKQIYESFLSRDSYKIKEANIFARENAVETFNAFIKSLN
jgi:colanic acid/amylovoran biosynthesis protein